MKKIITVITAVAVLLITASCIEQPYKVSADPEVVVYNSKTIGAVTFQWHVNGSNLDCILSAAYTGWVAVAFNPGVLNHAAGGNLIIGYVDGSGAHVSDENPLTDDHQTDIQQDITNITGTQIAGTTELRFTIPLNSGDANDMLMTPGQTFNIFVAACALDDITAYHDEYGSGTITL